VQDRKQLHKCGCRASPLIGRDRGGWSFARVGQQPVRPGCNFEHCCRDLEANSDDAGADGYSFRRGWLVPFVRDQTVIHPLTRVLGMSLAAGGGAGGGAAATSTEGRGCCQGGLQRPPLRGVDAVRGGGCSNLPSPRNVSVRSNTDIATVSPRSPHRPPHYVRAREKGPLLSATAECRHW